MKNILIGLVIGVVLCGLFARGCSPVPPDVAARADSLYVTRAAHDSALAADSIEAALRDSTTRAVALAHADTARNRADSLQTLRKRLQKALNLGQNGAQEPRTPGSGDSRADSLENLAQTAILEAEARKVEADSLRGVVREDSLTKNTLRRALARETIRRAVLEQQNEEIRKMVGRGRSRLSLGPFVGGCTTGKGCAGFGLHYAIF